MFNSGYLQTTKFKNIFTFNTTSSSFENSFIYYLSQVSVRMSCVRTNTLIVGILESWMELNEAAKYFDMHREQLLSYYLLMNSCVILKKKEHKCVNICANSVTL